MKTQTVKQKKKQENIYTYIYYYDGRLTSRISAKRLVASSTRPR